MNFGYPKCLDMRGRGISKIFRRNFFSQCREISYGKPSALCFKKIAVAKNFMDKRGGVLRFSAEDFLSHSAEKFRNGTLLCCVLETFW